MRGLVKGNTLACTLTPALSRLRERENSAGTIEVGAYSPVERGIAEEKWQSH